MRNSFLALRCFGRAAGMAAVQGCHINKSAGKKNKRAGVREREKAREGGEGGEWRGVH